VTGNAVVGGIGDDVVVEGMAGSTAGVGGAEAGTSTPASWPPEHAISVQATTITAGVANRLTRALPRATRL
jgi:hypothetical protein